MSSHTVCVFFPPRFPPVTYFYGSNIGNICSIVLATRTFRPRISLASFGTIRLYASLGCCCLYNRADNGFLRAAVWRRSCKGDDWNLAKWSTPGSHGCSQTAPCSSSTTKCSTASSSSYSSGTTNTHCCYRRNLTSPTC